MKFSFFILQRALQLLLVAWAVTTATFALASMLPGDFFTPFEANPHIRRETIERLRAQYGLDEPALSQYRRWMERSLRLDFGYSLHYGRPVSSVVGDALVATLWIALPAFLLGLVAGVGTGTFHALAERRPIGYALDLFSSTVLSLPALVLGIAALVLAALTGWFPVGGMSSPQLTHPSAWEWLLDRVHHLALPVLCLAVPVFAVFERIQHAATSGAAGELYLDAARARGLPRGHVFVHYLVRPALTPVLATTGPLFGSLLSGALISEHLFTWPGLGSATYQALFQRDVFLLLGCVATGSALLVAANLTADLLLYALDPRTRWEGAELER